MLDKYQPGLLILIHGGNDLLGRMPEQQLADNLRQMIYIAVRLSPKARIIAS
jgi:hypothetical protein